MIEINIPAIGRGLPMKWVRHNIIKSDEVVWWKDKGEVWVGIDLWDEFQSCDTSKKIEAFLSKLKAKPIENNK